MNFQKVEFLISAASSGDFPKNRLPEIAFAVHVGFWLEPGKCFPAVRKGLWRRGIYPLCTVRNKKTAPRKERLFA